MFAMKLDDAWNAELNDGMVTLTAYSRYFETTEKDILNIYKNIDSKMVAKIQVYGSDELGIDGRNYEKETWDIEFSNRTINFRTLDKYRSFDIPESSILKLADYIKSKNVL
jgi:hypothetical protein